MDEARAATIRDMYGSFLRRDFETLADQLEPDIEYVNPPDALEHAGERHRGKDQVLAIFRSFLGQWEYAGIDLAEVREGPGGVLIVAHMRVRGRASGVPTSDTFAHVLGFRGERVASFKWFNSREEGAAAAGVE